MKRPRRFVFAIFLVLLFGTLAGLHVHRHRAEADRRAAGEELLARNRGARGTASARSGAAVNASATNRKVRDFPRNRPNPPPAPVPVNPLREKLATTTVDLNFQDATLTEILEFMGEFAKVNIAVDERCDGLDKKISFAVKDLVLKHTLRLLVQQYDLAYSIRGDVLHIIPGNPDGTMHQVAYDVLDLLGPGNPDPEVPGTQLTEAQQEALTRLMEELKASIAPESWVERDGEVWMRRVSAGQLSVYHEETVHEGMKRLLEQKRSK